MRFQLYAMERERKDMESGTQHLSGPASFLSKSYIAGLSLEIIETWAKQDTGSFLEQYVSGGLVVLV